MVKISTFAFMIDKIIIIIIITLINSKRFIRNDLRRKESTRADQNSNRDILSLVHLTKAIPKKEIASQVQGIQLVGLVERDDRDATLVGDCDGIFLVSHGCCCTAMSIYVYGRAEF